ncbi:DUF4424 family protein [Rhodopseudomonas sp. RCAM05734]|uniref:DUF4424 family protein n=1 Tax=Rhodopseudomonas sp. RCAM05734 TaxID=3457549 RepID=UPI004043C722
MRDLVRCALVIAATTSWHTSAQSNDSAAELSIGGLRFMQTNAISMESEELRIALDSISIRYQFANLSGKPVTLTVAFPLPDIDLSEPESIVLPAGDPLNFVAFETKVDGRPAKFTFDQRAWIGDKDVSSLLSQLQFPMLPIGTREVRIADLREATREKLLSNGLLTAIGNSDNGRPIYSFAWIVKTSAVRQQTFPPDRSVTVEHRYRPSVGTAADTILRTPLRKNKALAGQIEQYKKDFCITDGMLTGLDRLAGKGALQERRISYVLHTGANWAAPIKTFKLVVDPGGKERFVSFCSTGLKPVENRPFEYEATNFKPDTDLKVLVVGKF